MRLEILERQDGHGQVYLERLYFEEKSWRAKGQRLTAPARIGTISLSILASGTIILEQEQRTGRKHLEVHQIVSNNVPKLSKMITSAVYEQANGSLHAQRSDNIGIKNEGEQATLWATGAYRGVYGSRGKQRRPLAHNPTIVCSFALLEQIQKDVARFVGLLRLMHAQEAWAGLRSDLQPYPRAAISLTKRQARIAAYMPISVKAFGKVNQINDVHQGYLRQEETIHMHAKGGILEINVDKPEPKAFPQQKLVLSKEEITSLSEIDNSITAIDSTDQEILLTPFLFEAEEYGKLRANKPALYPLAHADLLLIPAEYLVQLSIKEALSKKPMQNSSLARALYGPRTSHSPRS